MMLSFLLSVFISKVFAADDPGLPPDFFEGIIRVPFGMPTGEETLWGGIIPGLVQLLLFVAFVLSVIYLLLGGISWITSGGSKESLEAAKKKVTYAIVGLVLVLLSFAILFTFGDLFGINLRILSLP